jgi:hypothetical protein
MTDDLVKRLQNWKGENWVNEPDCAIGICKEAAYRIEELERHVELRDFFLTENNLWEKFAEGAREKMNDR